VAIDADVEKEVVDLLNEHEKLQKLLDEKDEKILEFGTAYQRWYSRALKAVEILGKDRLEEFQSYYRIDPKRKTYSGGAYVIQDFVKGSGATTDAWDKPNWDIFNTTAVRLYNQMQILGSLKGRLKGVLADVRGHLLAEIEDEELEVAAKLLRVNVRAAGALAGVVLEAHLQRVAANRQVPIGKRDPTVADLNDPLKKAGIYDLPTWRKIQHLADIRNLCDHKKGREPTEEEVAELVSGVQAIVKTLH
jgi:hypothetical protein